MKNPLVTTTTNTLNMSYYHNPMDPSPSFYSEVLIRDAILTPSNTDRCITPPRYTQCTGYVDSAPSSVAVYACSASPSVTTTGAAQAAAPSVTVSIPPTDEESLPIPSTPVLRARRTLEPPVVTATVHSVPKKPGLLDKIYDILLQVLSG